MADESDAEISAIQGVINSIKDLDNGAKQRVLEYVVKRFGVSFEVSMEKKLPAKVGKPEQLGPERLAASAGVETERLSNIYDFGEKSVFVHKALDGKDAEKQRTATKLVLIAHEEVLGVGELSGKALGKQMTELGIGSMGNFSQNLRSDEGIIVRGRQYKLNAKGRAEALDLVRKLSV